MRNCFVGWPEFRILRGSMRHFRVVGLEASARLMAIAFEPDRLETAQYLEVSAHMRPPNLQAHDMAGVD